MSFQGREWHASWREGWKVGWKKYFEHSVNQGHVQFTALIYRFYVNRHWQTAEDIVLSSSVRQRVLVWCLPNNKKKKQLCPGRYSALQPYEFKDARNNNKSSYNSKSKLVRNVDEPEIKHSTLRSGERSRTRAQPLTTLSQLFYSIFPRRTRLPALVLEICHLRLQLWWELLLSVRPSSATVSRKTNASFFAANRSSKSKTAYFSNRLNPLSEKPFNWLTKRLSWLTKNQLDCYSTSIFVRSVDVLLPALCTEVQRWLW